MVKFFMMVGLPGAGKSTYARNLSVKYEAVVVASDDIRNELKLGYTQSDHAIVFAELHKRVKGYLIDGKNVIYDATNVNSKKRVSFLNYIKDIPCEKTCVVMATKFMNCINQDVNRDKSVGYDVIKKMYLNWNMPYYFEGWDTINIVHETECYLEKPMYALERYENYGQLSKHHSYTLGEHLKNTFIEAIEDGATYELYMAALLHDIGKPFTREIREDGTAKYWSHHNVGGYDSMFYRYKEGSDVPRICALINYHMHPYIESDKMKAWEKRWGYEFYKDIMRLHTYDKESH